jgi:hypothetical protein
VDELQPLVIALTVLVVTSATKLAICMTLAFQPVFLLIPSRAALVARFAGPTRRFARNRHGSYRPAPGKQGFN